MLIVIPLGVVLMAGFFFLGYYVGKYRSAPGEQVEAAPPLPEMAADAGKKLEEFTFYQTLTGKTEKTVSIDLRPRQASDEGRAVVKQVPLESPKKSASPPAQIAVEPDVKTGKKPSSSTTKEPDPQRQRAVPKGVPAAAASKVKIHYTLQIAAYPEKRAAEDEVKKMKKLGYAAFIASSELPGKGIWHRVRLGSFLERSAAEKLQKTLHAKEGISPMIVIE